MNELKGIAVTLLGCMFIALYFVDPTIPVLDCILTPIFPFIGLLLGIIGTIIVFKKQK